MQIIREALEQRRYDSLRLVFQPVIDAVDGDVVGVEALVRWDAGDGREIDAGPILAAALPDLELALDLRVLDQAAAAKAVLVGRGIDIPMHVNVTASLVTHPFAAEYVVKSLSKHGVASRELLIDISDRGFVRDFPTALAFVENLRGVGIGVHLEDIAAVQQPLRLLRESCFTAVKLDRSLVETVISSDVNRRLLRGLVHLAHDMGVGCIAKGVETGKHLDALRLVHCSQVQGFALARPMPLDALIAHIASRPPSTINPLSI